MKHPHNPGLEQAKATLRELSKTIPQLSGDVEDIPTWKPYLPEANYTRRKATDTLVIHCADTTADFDGGAADIRRWHIKENGWKDIGYHVVIRRNGKVEGGRPLWAVGAHVAGHNATSIGICLVGGTKIVRGRRIEDNNFTTEQWDTLARVVGQLMSVYPITKACGHRDFAGVSKYCPSFDVKKWLRENRSKL